MGRWPNSHRIGETPGDVFLCGEGRFQRRHMPRIDMLCDDGVVVRRDGTLKRAAHGMRGRVGRRLAVQVGRWHVGPGARRGKVHRRSNGCPISFTCSLKGPGDQPAR